jgi:hypothetical protein
MRVEDCTVAVERRSIGGCIDLAIVFTRQHASPIIKLTLLFAIPSLVLTWLYGRTASDLMLPSIAIFMFFTTFANAVIVAAVGPQVFGVPMSVSGSLKLLRSRFWAWSLMMLLTRFLQAVTGLCVAFPALLTTAYFGHTPEALLLERTPVGQITQRLSWLSKGGGLSRNIGRLICLTAFWALLSIGIFIGIDVLSNLLFNSPIFSGTIGYSPDVMDTVTSRLIDDPAVMVTAQISLWIPYPMIRVAWFFCYLDQRIRNECWDLELQFRTESIRLEEKAQ